ncbi:hypothetical protein ACMA5I_13010 [Paracoccaceae bacterium GXU_MW_L88]
MDRSLPMLMIGLIFGGGLGFAFGMSEGSGAAGHDHADPAQHSTAMAAGMSMASHSHDNPVEVAADETAPAITLTAEKDAMEGWNLHLMPQNFRFTPENVNTDYAPGEGHAHIYVNGQKLMRVYSEWVHLGALPSGDLTITASLYSNDHRPIMVDGQPAEAQTQITVE